MTLTMIQVKLGMHFMSLFSKRLKVKLSTRNFKHEHQYNLQHGRQIPHICVDIETQIPLSKHKYTYDPRNIKQAFSHITQVRARIICDYFLQIILFSLIQVPKQSHARVHDNNMATLEPVPVTRKMVRRQR